MEEKKNLWSSYDEAAKKELHEINEKYKACLDAGKTERECVKLAVEMAKEAGYQDIKDVLKEGKSLKAGDKVYAVCMEKMLAMFRMGEEPLSNGMNILGAHIDSPRIDVKQNPLYESEGMAYLDTHYYGGIKKYQWVTGPMALHGVVAKKDGSVEEISIGEKESVITDLLVHLAANQMSKKASEVIEGEKLDLLIGNSPLDKAEGLDEEEKETIKANVLHILKENYGIEEEDFASAELEIVPAGKARGAGLDRSMIGAYGHDDRVCSYTEMTAEIANTNPEWTSVVIFADKEEVGSDGNTGMHSRFLEYFLADLAEPFGVPVRRVLSNSKCLSADVSAAFDPAFADAYEKQNSSFINYGVCVVKYTGAGGKSSTNDCNAKFTSKVCAILDNADVVWQFGELGKVDQGGGGTVAKYIAELDVDTIDIGVPVLCMHAPMEIISKVDLYETHRGFYEFLVAKMD